MLAGLKTTVIISYNSVNGFRPGWHQGARLFIHALENGWAYEKGKGQTPEERRRDIIIELEKSFSSELNVSLKTIDEFYIYAGETLDPSLALMFDIAQANPKARIVLVACPCLWDSKVEAVCSYNQLESSCPIEIIPCECGGQHFLGKLARRILQTVSKM